MSRAVQDDLAARAAAYGVATWYENADHVRVDVAPDVVAAVVDLLGPRPEPRPAPGRPASLPAPPRTWGWMLQLYGLRSSGSWGAGDFADLAAFVRWAAGTGAGTVLVNPLHAVAPVDPIPASPYTPSSRRFVNPFYLHIEDLPEYRTAGPAQRGRVDTLRPEASPDGLIDYASVWSAKRAALELLFADPAVSDTGDVAGLEPTLRDFATYNALAERYGVDWHTWPEELRHPESPAVAKARAELADRVAFHAWLQERCEEQLARVNDAGETMAIGVVHDLAVGVDAGGADAWMLQDVLAQGASIGAPPDAFNQQGQDWGLATWRPDRLAATDYAAYRELVRAILGRGGGLRVDHVAGLWRLWWVPPGRTADQGTYVRYDADAMVGILVEEAARAGAVVVGEDLGTVQPAVTAGLHQRNILGSAVLWFAQDEDGEFVPPAQWPENAVASVSTHDLPTATGFLSAAHVRARAEAGALTRPVAQEQAAADEQRRRLLALLHAEGLLHARGGGAGDVVLAMHRLLRRTPCRVVLASPYDVLGEERQPNLPGTTDQYPNWRIALPVTLEQFMVDPRVRRTVQVLREPELRPAARDAG